MKKLLLTTFSLLAAAAFATAGSKEKITDINAALEKAKSENKVLFLEFGREACSNCQALRAMISKNEVQLPASKYVYADVNCDDPATRQVFKQNFHVVGSTLPFVVVVSPDGKQLAAHAGYGNAADFQKLLHEAAKASKKS